MRADSGIRFTRSGRTRAYYALVLPDSEAMLYLVIACVISLLALGGGLAVWLNERRRQRETTRLTGAIPVNSKWWRDQRTAHGELLYVAMGDSAAQGIGASRPGRSYVGLIASHLRAATGQSVRVVNLSQSGARLREALAGQVPQQHRLEPDILTVSIGANDIADFDRIRFASEMAELCAALPPGALIADLPCFFVGQQEKNVRIANAIVRKIAAENRLIVVPLYATTRKRGIPITALRNLAGDYFHPNDRGYSVWASAFIPLLPRVLSDATQH